MDPIERYEIVSTILRGYLLRHFNPETVRSDVEQYSFKGRRTDLQRRGGNYYAFCNNLGHFTRALMALYGTKEQASLYRPSGIRTTYYEFYKKIPWLASKLEPLSLELLTVGQVTARK